MIAILFACKNSIYKTLPGVDVFDIERDATTFSGLYPVVCHPPCRSWGRLAHRANPRPGEKELALFAVDIVRRNGGILEHPAYSKLWAVKGLPIPGAGYDEYKGFSISVDQSWWGHRAKKASWFYICGLDKDQLPALPMNFDAIQRTISSRIKKKDNHPGWKPELPKSEREKTPSDLAKWLVESAQKCKVKKHPV